MRTLITVAAALALLVGSQAMGASVNYKLLLGGDNHAAAWHADTPTMYSGGSDADGSTVDTATNAVLNWAVVVEVAGNYVDAPPAGAANLVFDLELRTYTGDVIGDLVAIGHGSPTTAGFFSTVNNGVASETQENQLQDAAFAVAFNIDGTGDGVGDGANGGRLIDTTANGGPYLDFFTYPSDAGFPALSTAPQGKLVGMGAGYKELTNGGAYTIPAGVNRVGVGMDETAYSGACTFLGIKPLFEGQINLKDLPEGKYILVVVAGTGNNIVPSDTGDFQICDPGITGKFAVAPSAVNGDSVWFNLTGTVIPCDPIAPVMTAAQSFKTHGAAGEFGIDLFPGKKTEDRVNGPTKVVVTFDRDIRLATGTAADVAVTNGTVSAVSATGAVLTVTMSGATALSSLTMSFPGVTDMTCTSSFAATTSTLCIASAFGDYSGDSAINASDLILVRNNLNKIPTAANFMADVDADGAINASDLIKVRNTLNKAIPAESRCP